MTQLKYILIFTGLWLCLSLNAQEGIKHIREVSIITDSTKVIADIWMPEHKVKKLQADLTYAWYYRQAIHYTQSDFSGQVLHGEYKLFHKSGKLLVKGFYEKGLRTGTWRFWNMEGILLQSIDYEEGRTNGFHKLYYPNGSLKECRTYKEGILHGNTDKYLKGEHVSQTCYRNGNMKRIVYYEDGKKKKVEKVHKKNRSTKTDPAEKNPDKVKTRKNPLKKLGLWIKGLFKRKEKKEAIQSEDQGL